MAIADIRVRDSDQRIFVNTTPTEKDLITQVPGSTWDKILQGWWLPLTWPACLQLRGVFGTYLQIGPELLNWARDERSVNDRRMILRESLEPTGDSKFNEIINMLEEESDLRLKPFQRAAVSYLMETGSAGLWDDMGSGKTPTMIRTMQVYDRLGLGPYPALVVCPNSLKHTVWARELGRWAPELRVSVVDGSASVRRKALADQADIYIINWETVRLHSRLAPYGSAQLTEKQREPKELNRMGFRTVVLDEAHRLCGVGQKSERQDNGSTITVPASQQALAAWSVLHDAVWRYTLTGTPVDHHVGDLWGVLHGIAPDWFPAKTRFLERYAQKTFGLFGGMEIIGLRPDTEKEFRAITQPRYRRIPQEVLLPQLPKFREPMIRQVSMSPKQMAAYREMEQTMLARLNEVLVAPSPGVQFARLSQFAAAHVEITGHDKEGHPLTKLVAPSSKVDDLVELLHELGNDEPLVVGAESRQLIELASARLDKEKISHGMVTGSVAPIDRAHVVNRFQDGNLRVVLLTFGAGAEGITLTRSRYVCYLQRSWRPMFNAQFRKRVQRIGAEGHDWLQEIEIRAAGTVEERRASVVAGKENRIEEVLRDQDAVRRLLGE